MDSFLESLEEEVFLKNNIVTYKWVIKHLRVPSNIAKQILYAFVEKKRSCDETVRATYMISGDRKSNEGTLVHEVCVIPDSELDSVKSKFEVVTAVHVYAVHKSPLQDVNILYSVDYQEFHNKIDDGQRCYSITCSTLKFRCTATPKNVINEIADGTKDKALPPPKTNDQPQINRKRPNGDLDRLFSKVAKKEKLEKSESLPLTEQKTPLATAENNTPMSKKIISDDSSAELVKKNTENSKASAGKITESKINFEDSKTKSKASAKKINKPKIKFQDSKTKTDKSNKHSVKTDFNGKKRRRIIQMSDSSEDESDNHEEEPLIKMPVLDDTPDPMSPTGPEKESVKAPEVLNQTRHKRVLVNETTLDDDGYLVTQKIWKDETEVVKENNPSVVKVKPVEDKPVLRQKQSTLMSFFKKK